MSLVALHVFAVEAIRWCASDEDIRFMLPNRGYPFGPGMNIEEEVVVLGFVEELRLFLLFVFVVE